MNSSKIRRDRAVFQPFFVVYHILLRRRMKLFVRLAKIFNFFFTSQVVTSIQFVLVMSL